MRTVISNIKLYDVDSEVLTTISFDEYLTKMNEAKNTFIVNNDNWIDYLKVNKSKSIENKLYKTMKIYKNSRVISQEYGEWVIILCIKQGVYEC